MGAEPVRPSLDNVWNFRQTSKNERTALLDAVDSWGDSKLLTCRSIAQAWQNYLRMKINASDSTVQPLLLSSYRAGGAASKSKLLQHPIALLHLVRIHIHLVPHLPEFLPHLRPPLLFLVQGRR